MKILVIEHENDYEAVDFENTFHGQLVSDLIARVEAGESLEGESGELPCKVHEVPEAFLSQELINFIRTEVQDYEASKHSNFYLEGTTVK